MKKLLLPILAVFIGILLYSPVLAKEPWDIKINCSTISTTLHFKDAGDPKGAKFCKTQEDQVAVSNTLVLLNGYVYTDLAEDLADPNKPHTADVKPDKTEDLSIGDEGKIFYWGPPWGEGPNPAIEYRAKLGLCDMVVYGSAIEDIETYGVFGYKGDWQAAADYMVKKLRSAAKEIEAKIAKECGAKNVVDTPKTEEVKSSPFSFIEVPIAENFEPPTFVGLIGFDTAICTPNDHQSCKISWEKILEKALKRSPSITIEDEKKVSPFEPGYIGEKMRVLDSGKVQYKSAITGEWADLQSETFLPERSMASGDWLKLRLDVGLTENVPAVLSLSNFQAEVVPGSVELQKGEIEFKIKSWGDLIKAHPVFTVETDNAQISTKDTHFWVSYDKDKKYTLVGVYDGQVEVKTKDGKTITISPDGDKPGVVMVAQKLSVTKLAIGGLVLAAIIFGVTLLLKRRATKFPVKKKGIK